MNSREFGDWIDAGRPPLPEQPQQPAPKTMSAEGSKAWNDWFTQSFNSHFVPALEKFAGKFSRLIGEDLDHLVDDAGKLTAEIQKNLEEKIAKLEAGQARTFNIRTTYDPQATYAALDVVTLGGTWFVARRDDPGPCPGEGWQAGPVGKQGRPGAKIKSWRYDVPNYTATPIMSDGSDAPAIDLRPFFERFQQETS